MSPSEYIGALNSYFECTAGTVLDHGGQVLLLIGDAVLAIFPTAEAGERMEKINIIRHDAGDSGLTGGLALHVGDLTYGNIGVPQRLQFAVVGPATNQVARIETLTKTLERPLLASAEFAVSWTSRGKTWAVTS